MMMTDKRRKALEEARHLFQQIAKLHHSTSRQYRLSADGVRTCNEALQALTEPAVPDTVRGLSLEWRQLLPHVHAMTARIRSLEKRALAQQGDRVPEGWKPVPVEPTGAMRREWERTQLRSFNVEAGATWRAMIAAAPEPDSGEGDG